MFGIFKRKSKSAPPPTGWQCGEFRHAQILSALEHATDSTVSLYRDGVLQWSRDVAAQLHQFTCPCVQHVLDDAAKMSIPVYAGDSKNGSDPNSAAMSMAQQSTESSDRIKQLVFQLPDSFADALACKRRWLAGDASATDIQAATDRVAQDTQFLWPSNFCLQINAMQTAGWCVLSALNIESPWLSAHGCAQTAASYLSCRAACQTVECSSAPHDTAELVWEAAKMGDQTFTRGVGCPQAGDASAEQLASQVITTTSTMWWQRLNDDLASALINNA